MIIKNDWANNIITLECKNTDEMREVVVLLSTLRGIKYGRFYLKNQAMEFILSILEEIYFGKQYDKILKKEKEVNNA